PSRYCARTPTSPPPTPFPYTTLFRSRRRYEGGVPARDHISSRAPPRAHPYGGRRTRARRQNLVTGSDRAPLDSGLRITAQAAEADRKSTRLNSSHQIISYAVFCLKKK